MQVLMTPQGDGWPATLTLNGAFEWEHQLLQSLFHATQGAELALNGTRLNITLVQPPQPEPEATETPAPTGGEPQDPPATDPPATDPPTE